MSRIAIQPATAPESISDVMSFPPRSMVLTAPESQVIDGENWLAEVWLRVCAVRSRSGRPESVKITISPFERSK